MDDKATGVHKIVGDLYGRVASEIDNLLRQQLKASGVDIDDTEDISQNCEKQHYPMGDARLCGYFYKGKKILGVRIAGSKMAIEFDIPNLKGGHK